MVMTVGGPAIMTVSTCILGGMIVKLLELHIESWSESQLSLALAVTFWVLLVILVWAIVYWFQALFWPPAHQ